MPNRTHFLIRQIINFAVICAISLGYIAVVKAENTGIEQVSETSVTFFVDTSNWADVHYQLNGGIQQNLRMQVQNGRNALTLTNLTEGDVVDFWFTYLQGNGIVTDSPMQSYTLSSTPVLSGRIEAEDYARYFDTTAGNTGGAYRNDDVDIEVTTDVGGGFNVGYTANGEWLEYQVNIAAGSYNVQTRVASNVGGASYQVNVDGGAAVSDTVGNTGGWQSFVTQTAGQITVSESGTHTLRVTMTGGEFNLNWLEFTPAGGTPPTDPVDSDGDGVIDANDQCPDSTPGEVVDAVGCPITSTGNIVPLYNDSTFKEPVTTYDRGDALITRFADRGRDRHAKEDQFQIYDHFLSHYWTHRTAQFEIADYVAKGGSTIEVVFITEWKLGAREFRAFYRGINTVAEYHGNYFGSGVVQELDHGTYDDDFNRISAQGDQYRYRLVIEDYRPLNWKPEEGFLPLQVGQRMEFEVSQFLDGAPEGRDNYYGTTYLYVIGEGLVPWKTVGDFDDKASQREDSFPIAQKGWLGGHTTLPYNYTNEPDNHFMQMATNLSNINGQVFVEGRRIHHSSFIDGRHNEHVNENGVFSDVVGKTGPRYIHARCAGCHERNGRAAPPAVGEPLVKWQVKVADANGATHPLLGNVFQPNNIGLSAADDEGEVTLASWTNNNGLRSPNYGFSKTTPERFSARIAPQLVGLGLLEAIDESTILAREDTNDADGDGITGKANRVIDPQTGETRLGRFGWKAGKASLAHQTASAFNTDMGVTNSIYPNPDCGASQANCGGSGVEVSDDKLNKLVKYVSLLGVRAQRNLDDPSVIQGESVFKQIGCDSCHTQTMQTSVNHPLAEIRNQTIHPYSDMLLHDMGPGLADNLGEGDATGAEWRTTPLWGIGLSACVTGGVVNPQGGQGNEICSPKASYLHDGRARSIDEAIRWHGGEGEAAKLAYESLSGGEKSALLNFLNSL